jgi:hypothetical protein
MTNTYKDSDSFEKKIIEELRLIRCCLERLLMKVGDYQDYQCEKFGKNFSLETHKNDK